MCVIVKWMFIRFVMFIWSKDVFMQNDMFGKITFMKRISQKGFL